MKIKSTEIIYFKEMIIELTTIKFKKSNKYHISGRVINPNKGVIFTKCLHESNKRRLILIMKRFIHKYTRYHVASSVDLEWKRYEKRNKIN